MSHPVVAITERKNDPYTDANSFTGTQSTLQNVLWFDSAFLWNSINSDNNRRAFAWQTIIETIFRVVSVSEIANKIDGEIFGRNLFEAPGLSATATLKRVSEVTARSRRTRSRTCGRRNTLHGAEPGSEQCCG
jgi:hypothetical protein